MTRLRTAVPTRMPLESAPHARTWMAWPRAGYMRDGSLAPLGEVLGAWAGVAHALARFEPVVMLVPAGLESEARSLLSADVELQTADYDDAWLRDSGPTFTLGADGLAAVDWVFNAWGEFDGAGFARDARIASEVARRAGARLLDSPLVNEGGGIHVDGEGTVLLTETVQLDPRRNPGWSKDEVEAELARTLGVETAIWLPRGLDRDYAPLGTRGHVDMVASFPEPGRVLLHRQLEAEHPDAALWTELHALLSTSEDARGRTLEVIALPAPGVQRDADGWVDYSYVNHAVANGGVVACAFGDPGDDRAAGILREVYPGREVVSVDARPIFALGGGIHCITQHEPALP